MTEQKPMTSAGTSEGRSAAVSSRSSSFHSDVHPLLRDTLPTSYRCNSAVRTWNSSIKPERILVVNILQAKMSLSTTAFILASLTAGGGTIGFIRTGSKPSIAAGLTVGALYGLGGYRINNAQPYGVELALAASLLLAGSSIPRAIKSQKPLPAGLSVLALFGLYSFGVAFKQARGL